MIYDEPIDITNNNENNGNAITFIQPIHCGSQLEPSPNFLALNIRKLLPVAHFLSPAATCLGNHAIYIWERVASSALHTGLSANYCVMIPLSSFHWSDAFDLCFVFHEWNLNVVSFLDYSLGYFSPLLWRAFVYWPIDNGEQIHWGDKMLFCRGGRSVFYH